MSSQGVVALWEWENDLDLWIPYDPEVARLLESEYAEVAAGAGEGGGEGCSGGRKVSLQKFGVSLADYEVQICSDSSAFQRNVSTGKRRPVRRRPLPVGPGVADGVLWRWQGDAPGFAWHNYSADISDAIEGIRRRAAEGGQAIVDLQDIFADCPYSVDVAKLVQRRNSTGFERRILRTTDLRFPCVDGCCTDADINQRLDDDLEKIPSTDEVVGTLPECGKAVDCLEADDSGAAEAVAPEERTDEDSSNRASAPVTPPLGAEGAEPSRSSFFKRILVKTGSTTTPSTIHSSQTAASQHPRRSSTVAAEDLSKGGALKMPSSVSYNPVRPESEKSQPRSPVLFSKSAPVCLRSSTDETSSSFAAAAPTATNSHPLSSSPPPPLRAPDRPTGVRKKTSSSRPRHLPFFATFTKAFNSLTNTSSAVLDMTNALLVPLSFRMVVVPAPIFSPPPVDPFDLLPVPGVPEPSRKAQKQLFRRAKMMQFPVEDVLAKYTKDVVTSVVEETFGESECSICMERLASLSSFSDDFDGETVSRLSKCGHAFHRACLVAMYRSGTLDASLQCPSCKTIHGEKRGNCPLGFMDYWLDPKHPVPGFDDSDGTITIVYHIKPGIQGPEHPNPGTPYAATGFPRECYLPNNAKGRLVLKLLVLSWERRLTFTVGVSATTGVDNTVTWNEIHHKTEWGSNRTGHGYPDSNYLDNVLMELSAQGVTPEDLPTAPAPVEEGAIEENQAVRPKSRKGKS